VSIREVAKRSGVSVATVSRVLNEPEKVSESTRERVLEHVRALDYIPNAAARTLVRRRSQLVGVVINTGVAHPDLKHPFFQDVLVGLKDAVDTHDYDLLLLSSRRNAQRRATQSFLGRALRQQVDGLVLMGVDRNDADLRALLERGLPVVAVDLDVTGAHAGYVMSDNVAGARLTVDHLASLGHERIATITGLVHTTPGADRLRGYRDGLRAHRLRHRVSYVREGDFYPESGYAEMRRLLALPRPPTAVFAASDDIAVGALNAIAEAGLSAPDDVAVVGFDDAQIAPLLRPSLTTIRQDKGALGNAAGTALVAMIESEDAAPPELVLPVELVVRESSGPHRG
jgi:LacI family transcriptional regulator